MPTLRYADWRPGPLAARRLPCGRRTRRFELLGRADEVLNIGGAAKLVPDVVAAAVHATPGLSEHFQMVARMAGHLDQLLVRVERQPGDDTDEATIVRSVLARLDEGSKELRAMSERGLIADMAVEVLPAGGLPGTRERARSSSSWISGSCSMADLRTELTLPGDLAIIPLARGYARGLARLAQLPDEDVDALELAADEACTNVVEHAFEQGEAGSFRLVGEIDPRALTLAIHEQGVPFDPSLVPSFTPSNLEEPAATSTRGLGLFLIGHVVDEARWINHGRGGKELRLVKYRPQRDVRSTGGAPSLLATATTSRRPPLRST